MLKHPFPFLKETFNNKGLSLVEVLVAAGIASIISLGIATMMENMFAERKRIMLLSTLRDLKTKLEANIRDSGSWTQTMTVNAGLSCMQNNTVCTAIYTGASTPVKIVLKDSAANTVADLLTWGDVGTNGFTESGGPCTTFSAAAGGGNDNCPISYRLVYNIWCPGAAATCTNPQLKITGRLIFNPGTIGILNRFRGLIKTGDLAVTNDGANTDGRYDIAVKRSAVDTNITFSLTAQRTGSLIASDGLITHCGTDGVGTCGTVDGTFQNHPLAWNQRIDSQNLVSIAGTAVTFNAGQGGPVHCTITVPAFGTMGFTAQLWNSTDGVQVASASTVAGEWSLSTAIMDAKFVAVEGKAYIVRFKCQQAPSAAAANSCALGFHTQPYTGAQDIMTMNCVRLDKSL